MPRRSITTGSHAFLSSAASTRSVASDSGVSVLNTIDYAAMDPGSLGENQMESTEVFENRENVPIAPAADSATAGAPVEKP